MTEPLVIRCPPELRAAALRLLHAAGDPLQQEGLADAVAAARTGGDSAFDGLFVAADQVGGACWVQPTAGRTAVVWPPAPRAPAGRRLLRSAAQYVDAANIPVAQINVAVRDAFDPAVMTDGGFSQLARLLYLYADVPRSYVRAVEHHPPAAGSYEFLGHADDDPAQLAALVEATYAGTLDCPALDGVRSSGDVLAGYRVQGGYLPQHWYRVKAPGPNGRPIGVLILSSYAATGNWELVYMGVVPQARGQGVGRVIVDFALQAAAQGGAERLVLAVDADNSHAVETYRAAGFIEWDRRVVYARLAENGAVPRGA